MENLFADVGVGGWLTRSPGKSSVELAKTGTVLHTYPTMTYRNAPVTGRSFQCHPENVMAFQSVPETAQVDVVTQQNGVIMQNSFYGRRPGGYSLANLQELADDIDLAVSVTWLARMSNACLYVRTDVRGLEFANDLVATQNANSALGTDVTQPLPNNATFSIKKTSGLTGRSARGRTYWPSIPKNKEGDGDENTLDAAYIALIVSAVGSIRTNIDSTENWNPVLVSRFLDNEKRAFGVTFPWTGEMAVNVVIDTQRGRLP